MIRKASIVNVETTIPKIVKSSGKEFEGDFRRTIKEGAYDGGLVGIWRRSML